MSPSGAASTGTAVVARARILLIEDEPSVAAFLRIALERRGYEVVASPSAVEGLQLLATGDFRGVISDFRTPGGITGADVHDWLERHRPELARELFLLPATRPAMKRSRCWRKRARRALKNLSASNS